MHVMRFAYYFVGISPGQNNPDWPSCIFILALVRQTSLYVISEVKQRPLESQTR